MRIYSISQIRLLLFALIAVTSNVAAFDYYQVLPDEPLIPNDNPQTAAKIALGKQLFYETRLSQNNDQHCGDCHVLLAGGDNDQAYAYNAQNLKTQRSVPGLWNIGLQTVLYWDGRAPTLEALILDHLKAKDIMALKNPQTAVKQLAQQKRYTVAFKRAFPAKGDGSLDLEHIAKALASFLRALMSPNSPYDRYLRGDKQAMSKVAIQGMQLFNDVGCLACHFGVNLAGPAPGPALKMGDGFYELFPNHLGTRYDQSHGIAKDLGRYHFSKNQAEKHMWRVPPLRNIAMTAPYFHNGSAATLDEAIRIMAKTQLQKELNDAQVTAIRAFLESLSGERPAVLDAAK